MGGLPCDQASASSHLMRGRPSDDTSPGDVTPDERGSSLRGSVVDVRRQLAIVRTIADELERRFLGMSSPSAVREQLRENIALLRRLGGRTDE